MPSQCPNNPPPFAFRHLCHRHLHSIVYGRFKNVCRPHRHPSHRPECVLSALDFHFDSCAAFFVCVCLHVCLHVCVQGCVQGSFHAHVFALSTNQLRFLQLHHHLLTLLLSIILSISRVWHACSLPRRSVLTVRIQEYQPHDAHPFTLVSTKKMTAMMPPTRTRAHSLTCCVTR